MPFKLTQISIERKQNADNNKKLRTIERKAQYKKGNLYNNIRVYNCKT